MKKYFWALFILISLLTSCVNSDDSNDIQALQYSDIEPLVVPEGEVDLSELMYDNKTSLWTLEGQLFSGYATSYSTDGALYEKLGILNGRKQNEAIRWFPDGHYQSVAHYHKGKLHGERKLWSPDSTHVLLSQLNYNLGKLHGVQKKWYATGEIFKVLNLEMGQEQGMQQAFRKNGDLFANYEAKEGRIFGLKKAALCFGLEDQKIQ